MWILVLLGAGCPVPPDPRNCTSRTAFYPDADGDGLGEPTDLFVGCEAPPGWVATLAPPSTGDTGPTDATTGDTGETPSTGDTGTPGTGDTGTPDTGETGETGGHTGDTGTPAATGETGGSTADTGGA